MVIHFYSFKFIGQNRVEEKSKYFTNKKAIYQVRLQLRPKDCHTAICPPKSADYKGYPVAFRDKPVVRKGSLSDESEHPRKFPSQNFK